MPEFIETKGVPAACRKLEVLSRFLDGLTIDSHILRYSALVAKVVLYAPRREVEEQVRCLRVSANGLWEHLHSCTGSGAID